jgi:drug/metabolite transporter (DMT)-like permease
MVGLAGEARLYPGDASRQALGSGTIGVMHGRTPGTHVLNPRMAALASLHVAVALFGFAGLFGMWIALPPTMIVLGRTVVAAAALGTLLAMRGQPRTRFEWQLGINGALLALHWVAFFQGIQIAGVAIGLLGFATFPAFVLVLEWAFLRRRTRVGDWVLAAVAMAGLVLIVPDFRLANEVVQGLLWGVLAGATFALLAVCNRALASRREPREIAFWQNACAAICLLPVVALVPAMPSVRDLGLILVLGLVCTALAHTLFIRSLRILSAHTASVVTTMEPVYGIALAAALLGEIPNAATLAGGVLTIGAALWATVSAPRT